MFAYSFNRMEWKRLAERNRKGKHLAMACCGRPAVAKTSHCGTQFFAHARRERWNSCPKESEEHLLAKDIVARAVADAGWTAEAEARLKPEGLVADVLATSGRRRVAFEVQWSRQTDGQTCRRHKAYEEAGIRELWLFKQWEYPLCKEVPAFRIAPTGNRSFDVCVWRDGNGHQKPTRMFQSVGLAEFIKGALAGRLKWMPAAGLETPVIGHVAEAVCRRGHPTGALIELELDIGRLLPGHPNPRLRADLFAEHPEFLRNAAAMEKLGEAGIALRFGMSKWREGFAEIYSRSITHACAACGAMLDSYDFGKLRDAAEPKFELLLELTPKLLEGIPGLRRQLECWWFDQG